MTTEIDGSGEVGVSIRSIKALAPPQRSETLGSRGQQGNPGGVPARGGAECRPRSEY
jgi:hypothetical protein